MKDAIKQTRSRRFCGGTRLQCAQSVNTSPRTRGRTVAPKSFDLTRGSAAPQNDGVEPRDGMLDAREEAHAAKAECVLRRADSVAK
jgi:hypothetical protein